VSRTLIKDPPRNHIPHDTYDDRAIQYYCGSGKIVTPVVTEHILEKFSERHANWDISTNRVLVILYRKFIDIH